MSDGLVPFGTITEGDEKLFDYLVNVEEFYLTLGEIVRMFEKERRKRKISVKTALRGSGQVCAHQRDCIKRAQWFKRFCHLVAKASSDYRRSFPQEDQPEWTKGQGPKYFEGVVLLSLENSEWVAPKEEK